MIPPKDQLVICFAHAAYQMKACFDALNTGIASFEVRERDEFERRAPEADVIVVSGLWHNGLIPLATQAALHPVDRLGHRPVRQGGAGGTRHVGWRARPA